LLVVLIVLLASVIYATYRGFVRETLSIFAWAAAAFATLYFGPAAAPFLAARMSTGWLGTLVAYGGIFLVVLIPLSFVSFRFAEGVQNSPVGAVDRRWDSPSGSFAGSRSSGLPISCSPCCADSLTAAMDDERAASAADSGIQRRAAVACPDQHIQTARDEAAPAPPGRPSPKPAPRQPRNMAPSTDKRPMAPTTDAR
jgi:hypothetical protein